MHFKSIGTFALLCLFAERFDIGSARFLQNFCHALEFAFHLGDGVRSSGNGLLSCAKCLKIGSHAGVTIVAIKVIAGRLVRPLFCTFASGLRQIIRHGKGRLGMDNGNAGAGVVLISRRRMNVQ